MEEIIYETFMTICALFWDFDNTLIETAQAHWDKHVNVLKDLGITLDPIYKRRVYENNGYQNWLWMHQELGLTLPESQYLQAIDEEFQKVIEHLKIRDGASEILELAKSLKIPQAIITNARKTSAEPVIKSKGLAAYMEFILYKEDYEGRKPSPSPYLKGLEKMQEGLQKALDPQNCLAIEDDPKGVEAAKKANLCVVQRPISNHETKCPFADYSTYEKDSFINLISQLLQKP